LLGVALGTILLPSLAKHHSDADQEQYSALLDWGLRLAFVLALPAALALGLLAVPLIATLYQYGKFSINDVWQTRSALLGYSAGLLGLILVKILAPGFFARQNLRTPVKIAFLTVFITQVVAMSLMGTMGHAGLTLATSVGACFNALLLFLSLRRAGYYAPQAGWLPFLGKLVLALAVLGATLVSLSPEAQWWIDARLWARLGRLAILVAAGAAAYFTALYALGFRLADFNRREAEE
jgi:putative peptidoglycan lipid II flippase